MGRYRQRPQSLHSGVGFVVVVVVVLWSCLHYVEVYSFSFHSQDTKIRRSSLLPLQISSSTSTASTNNQGGDSEDRRDQSLQEGDDAVYSLNLNLDSLAEKNAAPRAHELLHRIQALYEEGYYTASPDVVSYNSVLKAWKEDDNPVKAFELLQEMIDGDNGDGEIKADVISFNTVILAFARTGNHLQAEYLLREMQERPHLPEPNTVTYNAVLYAFAQSKDKGMEIKAEDMLKEMISENVVTDTTSFNTVILAHTNQHEPKRAQELLLHMETLAAAGSTTVRPDVYSYTTVVQAWAKSKKPLEAEAVLKRMTSQGLSPNRFTYTSVMTALAKNGEAERAEAILKGMIKAWKEGGNDNLRPDTVAFSTVIDGWSKVSSVTNPEAAEHAVSLLDYMKGHADLSMGPNAITYTSVLTALGKSGQWEACDDAYNLLMEMINGYENGNMAMKPTTIHYNTVLHAYARSPRANKALKAHEFLSHMEQYGPAHCRPDIVSYNSLLMACANAFGNNQLKERSFLIALEAFKKVVQKNKSKEQTSSLEQEQDGQNIDRSAKNMMQQPGPPKPLRPTSTTFVHFCKTVRRLVSGDASSSDSNSNSKLSVLKTALTLACDRGVVSALVIKQCQMACSTDDEWKTTAGELATYVGLKDNADVHYTKLPKEWIIHARR